MDSVSSVCCTRTLLKEFLLLGQEMGRSPNFSNSVLAPFLFGKEGINSWRGDIPLLENGDILVEDDITTLSSTSLPSSALELLLALPWSLGGDKEEGTLLEEGSCPVRFSVEDVHIKVYVYDYCET